MEEPELQITLTVSQLGVALLGAVTLVQSAQDRMSRNKFMEAMNLFNSYMPKLELPKDEEIPIGSLVTMMDSKNILWVISKDKTGYFAWDYADTIEGDEHFENCNEAFHGETYEDLLNWWGVL